jgi:LPXTG-motif cell wall-anchored protein
VPSRWLTILLVALLVAPVAPTAALADGAGDQQYQDPLAAPTTPSKPKKKAVVTAPAATTPAATPSAGTAPAASAPARAQLPRTGAPAGLIALAGALMVVLGLALRRGVGTTT